MPVPTSLLTLNPLPSPRVSRLQTSLIRMMSTTKNLKIIPRIIIRLTILGTNDMIDLIRMSATRTQHAIITDHRILATPPVIIQHLTTRPLPTRIEPFLAMRLIPIVGHHHSSVLQEGIEPSRHRTTHFECAASTIPPPKQGKSRHSDSGDCSRRLGGSAKTRAATRRLRRPFPQPVGRLSTACWTRTNIDGFGDRHATSCTNAICVGGHTHEA